jgi:AhpD family alkylhydroperoxidase
VSGSNHQASWLRNKPASEVKRDALAMAAQKHREGCGPCADAYLDLARQNGATEQEILEVATWLDLSR